MSSPGRCQVRRGLLVLRECGAPAERTCASCGIWVCAEHAVQHQGQVLCPECAARSAKHANAPGASFARRRAGYYDRFGLLPVYWDTDYFDVGTDYSSVEDVQDGGQWDIPPSDLADDELDPFES